MTDAAMPAGHIGELRAWALIYAEHGLDIFPVDPRTKAPMGGVSQHEATTDPAALEHWWRRWPGALIGHRLAPDVVILDIDPRHGGHDTWQQLKAEHGNQAILTRYHASGRGDGGGHLWFLRPDDKITIRGVDEWAKRRGAGHPVLGKDGKPTNRWTGGIDILQHDHRYTILPPSPHPDTGEPYRWVYDVGVDVAPMPAWLADLLTEQPNPMPSKPAPGPRQADSIADWYTDTHPFSQLLPAYGWQLRAGNGNEDGSRWRHPSASAAHSATIRHGYLFVYSPNTPLEPTGPGDPNGYTPFRAYAAYEHRGDLQAASRAARELKDGPRPVADIAAILGAGPARQAPPNIDPETGEILGKRLNADPAHHLPDDFWRARPHLAHIRQAARARLVAADAVLGAVLTRIAAITPHSVELPAIIGSPVGLTYYAGIVGPPEAGKSAAAGVAAELLPAPEHVLDRLPIGSGEGMVEVLFDLVDEEDENGKKRKVKRQTRHAAIFHIDEGAILSDLAGRQGSTLMPTLRTAFSHGVLGNANASIERRRILDGLHYVYGITLGIQPELAGPLLGDTAAGTPQRFVWLMATDPGITATPPEHPGELDWTAPDNGAFPLEQIASRRGYRRHVIDIAPAIRTEVIADRVSTMTGEQQRDQADAHQILVRLKTAALLAILDGRVDVGDDDWQLAHTIVTTSRAIRRTVEGTIGHLQQQKEHAAVERHARREVTVEATKEARALESASKALARAVHRHADAKEHPDPGCTRRCITQAIASKHRAVVTVDDALADAEHRRWITPSDGRWTPGDSRPA